eukprot:6439012-Amphidinium_carterae.1
MCCVTVRAQKGLANNARQTTPLSVDLVRTIIMLSGKLRRFFKKKERAQRFTLSEFVTGPSGSFGELWGWRDT